MDLNSFSLLGGERRLQDEQLETQNNDDCWMRQDSKTSCTRYKVC